MGDEEDYGGDWTNNDTGASGEVEGSSYYSGPSMNPAAYQPASYSNSPGATGGSRPSYVADFSSANPAWGEMDSWGRAPTGGGGPGGGGAPARNPTSGGSQPFQRISVGTPERTLYDRYSSMLLNPDKMTSDPAYQFLFNQGQQALNRSLAAKRMTYSGKAMNDTTAYGAGVASDYFNKMIPQYQQGAQTELSRFMGPAGLLPSYAGVNNRATSEEGANMGANALIPAYQQMLSGPNGWGAGGGGSTGIGYGGGSSSYRPQTPSYSAPPPPPRLASSGGYNSGGNYGIPELMDEASYA